MKTIHHVVDIDAAHDVVWRSLTDEDALASWWSTKVDSPPTAVGARTVWTFAGDFNPVMETIAVDAPHELVWQCVDGHEPWQDSTFRFQLEPLEDVRTRLRFWHEYAVELADDYYGVYNFNWGYYLESLRLFCTTATGKPFRADGTGEYRSFAVVDQGHHATGPRSRRRRATGAQSRQNSLPSMPCITMHDSLSSSTVSSRTRTAPSAANRAHSASSLARRCSPTSPVPTRTSRCSRFLTILPSGTRWKNSRGPTPEGSTHANHER